MNHWQNRVWATPIKPAGKKLVLLVYGDLADRLGEAWPSLSNLQQRTGLRRTQVTEHRRQLVKEDYLIRVTHGGRHATNTGVHIYWNARFRLNPSKLGVPLKNERTRAVGVGGQRRSARRLAKLQQGAGRPIA